MTGVAVRQDAGTAVSPESADLVYLWARLGAVEWRVRQAVAARRAVDPAPDDPYRGLYLTPEAVQDVLAAPRQPQLQVPEPNPELDALAALVPDPGPRLLRLAADFGLTPVDLEFLLVAMAPDVDPRFERLYGYLNDDVTRRRATVGLALQLCGVPLAGPGRFRFTATAPLVAGGLVEVHDPATPALSQALRVPDRVVAHLLGDDVPDPVVAGLARIAPRTGAPAAELPSRLGAGLRSGVTPVHLRDAGGDVGPTAVAALAAAGRGAVVLDVAALADREHPDLAAVVREARLRGAGVVLGPLEFLVPERTRVLRELVALAGDVPVVLHSRQHWDPRWTARPVLSVPVASPPLAERASWWTRALGGEPAFLPGLAGYRLGSEEIDRVVAVAGHLATVEGEPIGLRHVRAGVRAQNGAGLDRLTRRIVPAVGWDDVVLPEQTRNQLAELVVRARHRERVLGEWRMRPGGGRGRGVVALFAGESGTGKTMSAEVVAAEIGMDLYVVDLSTVVDKYVGETEKNLERIFTEAAGVHGVLLFDEADAVFGKRSEVQSAHDRYANVESAYLLQRMESFDGIAVLTTNLRSNVDEAFTRRIDVIADFPVPDAEQRLALWDRCLGPALPRAGDLDLAFCAERFELAGGSIRACAVTAAYLAAAADRPVAMTDVMTAVHQEYRKLGRLVLESEFGSWFGMTR
ncbi:ATP-binding protein [Lentzea jiangxiensis]|uniref:ATPase family associated with various cellular activities (AAA) n=1 Tax=Lentzea jiangxiensis TaxID=641025 RepID=A0A1H0WS90_9PSEU|nr:ATP-binding protein [Lentzea jiangxiensis]SDP93558.1 ATPase family associated with various cellular activities (AAA) [Lentzea jiangxiensis]